MYWKLNQEYSIQNVEIVIILLSRYVFRFIK